MRLLLDTQVLVWMVTNDPRLFREWIGAFQDAENELWVSAVTAFEFADLQARHRLPSSIPFDELADNFGLRLASFPGAAWRRAQALPTIHRDPVDRMLIAHALEDDMVLVTADERMRQYPARFL